MPSGVVSAAGVHPSLGHESRWFDHSLLTTLQWHCHGCRHRNFGPLRPFLHSSRPTSEAKIDEFTPKLGGVVAALRPASFEAIVIGSQIAFALRLTPEGGTTSPQPASDCFAFGTELDGNL